jgi:polar amino acid transport system substrate-binding protein
MITRLVLFFILSCISHSSYSISKVRLAVENSWPPYSDSQGNGLSKDIIKKAYNAVNIEVEFIVVPYARALHLVKIGSADGAFNVTKQENTESIFNFGEEPLLQAKASFYYNNNSALDFASSSDIPDGVTIALILGYEYGDIYQKNKHRFKEVRLGSQQQIIQLIRKNRVDVGIMFDEVAKETLTTMGLKHSSIRKGKMNHRSDIYVAFSKDNDTTEMMNLLDKGLKSIGANSRKN